jgi:Rhamnan synthesis protein F/Glycosyltransferase WbsX
MRVSEHFGGFYQPEPDYRENGIWVSDHFSFPFLLYPGDAVSILGLYYPDLIAKQTGDAATLFTVSCGQWALWQQVVSSHGEFAIRFKLPSALPWSASSLTVTTDKVYVPSEIGQAQDNRRLSWRVKSICASRGLALDFTKSPELVSTRQFAPRSDSRSSHDVDNLLVLALYHPIRRIKGGNESNDWAWQGNGIESRKTSPEDSLVRQFKFPVSLGYYDFRSPGTLASQINLARKHGINGFCFQHHITDDGDPQTGAAGVFLRGSFVDFRFCLSLNLEQVSTSSREGIEYLVAALSAFFLDERYVLCEGLPLVILLPDTAIPPQTLTPSYIRNTFGIHWPALPPITFRVATPARELDRRPCDEIGDGYLQFAENRPDTEHAGNIVMCSIREESSPKDQTGDQQNETQIFEPHHLTEQIADSLEKAAGRPPGQQILLLDSWNDWKNNRHLEADQRWGYAKLAVIAATRRNRLASAHIRLVEELNKSFRRKHDTVIVVHIFYEDLIDEIFDKYLSGLQHICDLLVTCSYGVSNDSLLRIRAKFKNSFFQVSENRGRDVRPFIQAWKMVRALGYLYGCKLHSKRSPQLADGDKQRHDLLGCLVSSPELATEILTQLKSRPGTRIVSPLTAVRALSTDPVLGELNSHWLNTLLLRGHRSDLVNNYQISFPAGSMYWFNVAAMHPVFGGLLFNSAEFECEAGQIDGTLAHAIERVVCVDWVTGHDPALTEMARQTKVREQDKLAAWIS